jgi:hypothetical protein
MSLHGIDSLFDKLGGCHAQGVGQESAAETEKKHTPVVSQVFPKRFKRLDKRNVPFMSHVFPVYRSI